MEQRCKLGREYSECPLWQKGVDCQDCEHWGGGRTMRKKNPLTRIVRISEETFAEVQKHAEPLKDNFESALRKALGMSKRDKGTTQE